MSTNRTTGHVSVSVRAGHITATSQPIHPQIGKQVEMGNDMYFHITPEVAAQWLPVLTKIAEGGE
ncbi:MAG TPA: hypothetical protein DEV93_03515 [Chloroflexi bacterium]|nr:hypothetical protein [Chloroflexota bacterium]